MVDLIIAVGALVWLTLSTVVGVAAHRRGRMGWLWFLMAALAGPVAGIFYVLFWIEFGGARGLSEAAIHSHLLMTVGGTFFFSLLAPVLLGLLLIALGRPPLPQSPSKTCPRCAESVLAAATACRFCNHEFDAGHSV